MSSPNIKRNDLKSSKTNYGKFKAQVKIENAQIAS